MHTLDINFHKTSSKNTVFAINRAVRSLETGVRFSLGFFVPIVAEFTLLCGMLIGYCGPIYLGNMLMTLGCYTYYTRAVSKKRRIEIKDKKEADKK
jgi:ABC-type transport system involved in Fe-S cluster assembly fused permease/ATPase subunit